MWPKQILPCALFLLVAVAGCDRGDSLTKLARPASTQPAASVAPPATSQEGANQAEDKQTATDPWVMPSPEELAVKAAVIKAVFSEEKARAEEMAFFGRKVPDVTRMTVFLDLPRAEEAALMPMLAPDVSLLKESSKMQVNKESGEAFDADTSRPALVIKVQAVQIPPAPIPRRWQEATAAVATSPTWRYRYFVLTKASGNWVVTERMMGAVE